MQGTNNGKCSCTEVAPAVHIADARRPEGPLELPLLSPTSLARKEIDRAHAKRQASGCHSGLPPSTTADQHEDRETGAVKNVAVPRGFLGNGDDDSGDFVCIVCTKKIKKNKKRPGHGNASVEKPAHAGHHCKIKNIYTKGVLFRNKAPSRSDRLQPSNASHELNSLKTKSVDFSDPRFFGKIYHGLSGTIEVIKQ